MTMKFQNAAFMLIFAYIAITCTSHSEAAARTWTLSELDTLSDREWLWIEKKYQEPISEYYTETDRPDKLPERKQYITPSYPKAAREVGAEGSVWLKVLIDEKGKVRVARIFKDSGSDVGFEDAAMKAAIKSIWKPAVKDGRRIAIWVTYEAPFYLETTMDGKPIKLIDRWHWSVRGNEPTFYEPSVEDESTISDIPDMDEYTNVDTPPERVKDGFLRYPESARKSGLEGNVWVKILLNINGDVAEAIVAKESGCNCGFEDAALWSAIHSKWRPAKFRGTPLPLWVTYEVRFQMVH